MRKTYFTLSKALAVFFIASVLFSCRSHVPTERVTYSPPPPLKQELPPSPAAPAEIAPAEDIPPLEPRKPAAVRKPSLLLPPPVTHSEEWLIVV
jgi:hypothetical protein